VHGREEPLVLADGRSLTALLELLLPHDVRLDGWRRQADRQLVAVADAPRAIAVLAGFECAAVGAGAGVARRACDHDGYGLLGFGDGWCGQGFYDGLVLDVVGHGLDVLGE